MSRSGGPSTQALAAADVRRAVVHAQFAPGFADAADVLRHTGILQLDPLARVDKAHRLTALTRLGPATRSGAVDGALWRDDAAVGYETFSRIACLVPVDDWPLHRLDRERRGAEPVPADLRERILAIVAGLPGGATIGDIETGTASARTTGWEWSPVKIATERLLRDGELVVTARRGVARLFDLPERRLPGRLLDARLDDDEVLAGLARRALASLGVVTPADLSRVFSLTRAEAARGLASSGTERVVAADDREPAYLDPAAALVLVDGAPPALDGPRLVGPFDQLLRDRARARRVFGFDYVFEAYKPVAARVHGHYVLGVLAGDRFVGRVDARRDGTTLRLGPVVPERGVRTRSAASAARRAGRRLARQLELELVVEDDAAPAGPPATTRSAPA